MTEQTLPIGPVEPTGPAAHLVTLMTTANVQRYAGVLLCPLGEDGEWLVAPGHVPPDLLAEAVAEYAERHGWWPGEDYADDGRPDLDLAARTQRVMATITPPSGEWGLNWTVDGTVPVTVVDWE